ncbi:MAG TPA: TetR/AcrR family transcriptional regulator [Desulfosporosinus sp.]|nr:TetR/AcrR family transcriptional regulator [Desulfosporosinus sp.]
MSGIELNNRRQRKKEATKNKIIAVAVELFNKQGFEQTTNQQIAERADVAIGTLYNYFETKELIVSAYIQEVGKDSVPLVDVIMKEEKDTSARLLALLLKMSQWNDVNRELVEIYVRSRMQSPHKPGHKPGEHSGFGFNLIKILRLGQQQGELRDDLAVEYLAKHLAMMYYTTLISWLADLNNDTLQNNLEKSIDLFLNGSQRKLNESGGGI